MATTLATPSPPSRETEEIDLEAWEEWDGTTPFLVHACAGSFAGVAEHTIMFPLDTAKTFLQTEGSGGREALRKLVELEGRQRMWRGASTMLFGCVPAHALYFSVYEQGKISFGETPMGSAAAGLLSTLGHDLIMTPMDVLKQRMQLGFHSSLFNALGSVMRVEGTSALFRSFPTVLAMNLPLGAISVSTNDAFKRFVNPDGDYSFAAALGGGFVAGGTAGALTTPLDVIRTRIQTQGLMTTSIHAEDYHQKSKSTPVKHAKDAAASSAAVSPATSASSAKGKIIKETVAVSSNSTSSISKASYSTTGGGGGRKWMPSSGGYRVHQTSLLGWGAPMMALRPKYTRPRYSRPVRCPLPIALWAAGTPPGSTTNTKTDPIATTTTKPVAERAGFFKIAKEIYQFDGPRGFFRGAFQRFAVQAPGVAVSWAAYETAKEAFGAVYHGSAAKPLA